MNEETTLFQGSSSLVTYFGTFMLGLVSIIAGIALAVFVSLWFLILSGAALIVIFSAWLINRCRVYQITTERIRLRRGILTRRTDELELYRVQDLTLVEPLKQRFFGSGTIVIATNDTTTPTLEIEAIRGAREVREELRKSIEICRDRKRVRVTELE